MYSESFIGEWCGLALSISSLFQMQFWNQIKIILQNFQTWSLHASHSFHSFQWDFYSVSDVLLWSWCPAVMPFYLWSPLLCYLDHLSFSSSILRGQTLRIIIPTELNLLSYVYPCIAKICETIFCCFKYLCM